jgi:hypothetical protein
MAIKKGNWVTFKLSNGEVKLGLVIKGGKTLKVNYDFTVENCKQVTTDPRYFTLSEAPTLDGDSGFLDKWEVKGYKEIQGHDGMAWNVTLYRNGKKAVTVVDDSWGGGNQYHDIIKGATEEFTADAKELWGKHSVEEESKFSSTLDCFMDWMIQCINTPISIEAYTEDFDKVMAT